MENFNYSKWIMNENSEEFDNFENSEETPEIENFDENLEFENFEKNPEIYNFGENLEFDNFEDLEESEEPGIEELRINFMREFGVRAIINSDGKLEIPEKNKRIPTI